MRLIDAEQMEKHIMENKVFTQYFKELVQSLIWGENTVDAMPVVRGAWVKSDDYKGWLVCSACHDCYVDNAWVNGKKWRYCPNCGALMEDKSCG